MPCMHEVKVNISGNFYILTLTLTFINNCLESLNSLISSTLGVTRGTKRMNIAKTTKIFVVTFTNHFHNRN